MIQTKEASKLLVIKFLKKKGYKIIRVNELNKGRHKILYTQQQNFYLLFKRQPLHSFNYLHEDYVKTPNSFAGHGETINQEFLEFAIKENCLLLFTYQSDPFDKNAEDRIYYIHPNEVKAFCTMHNLLRKHKEPVVERMIGSQSLVSRYEVTYDFPIQLLKRLN